MSNHEKPRKPMDSTYTAIREQANCTEPLKPIISNGIWDILGWHIWGIISVSVSILLITLNVTHFAIAGELGRNEIDTANVLGALQVAVQMHGLTISASLFHIARQWIQGSMLNLDRGIPLALVGAERELGLPSFVISHGFITSVKYAASLWSGPQTYGDLRRKWDVGMVTGFLFVSCIVSVMAGPASGILMIPRVQWFFDSAIDFPYMTDGWNTYPHIMVPPELGHGNYSIPSEYVSLDPLPAFLSDRSFRYWSELSLSARVLGPATEQITRHHLPTTLGIWYINTTTTWGRSMSDKPGTGSSYAKSILHNDAVRGIVALSGERGNRKYMAREDYDRAMQRWSQRIYVMDATAIVTEVNCAFQPKKACPPSIDPGTAPWCLDDFSGPSQNLILLAQKIEDNDAQFPNRSLAIGRVYITEGRRTETNPAFFDSLLLVFNRGVVPWRNSPDFLSNDTRIKIAIPTKNMTVCSIATTLTPAVLTAFKIRVDGKFADYSLHGNRTIQFHERWLDHASMIPKPQGTIQLVSGNFTFPPRSMVQPIINPTLMGYGKAVNFMDPRAPCGDPAWLEIVIGGGFASRLSWLGRSTSQYAIHPNVTLPDALMPEPRLQTPGNKGYTIKVYNQGYAFRLSMKVGILGVMLLILHAVIVLVGSLWQLVWERSVFHAWNTVPEYMALGLGSDLPDGVLENTCAGIRAGESLRTIVKVGVTAPEHLELGVGKTGMKSVLGHFEAKYGSRVKRRHKHRKRTKQIAETL